MALSRDDVQHIAELAKLNLTEAEIDQYVEQLSDILAYAENLSQLDTDAISPTASVLPLRNILADDEVQATLDRQILLNNAPDSEAGQIRVKAILD
jgi:aspartyl-tRNA(Asn)/glutamyl-tRNA(Gln) amidotransferase subunit C